jgi:hypothetical protein
MTKNKNSVSFNVSRPKIGPISNTILLVVLGCLLGLLYLTQVTKTDTYGYQLNSLQVQQQQLETQKQNLEVSSAQLQALNTVQSSKVSKVMTAVTPSAVVPN